ncbi:MAG: cell division protein ZapA [Oceanobacter sp.]
MANESRTLPLTILEREYRVNCPEGAEKHLTEAARYLDQKMAEIKSASKASGKIPASDRIAVIAALNITHQMLELQAELEEQEAIFSRLHAQLDDALGRRDY